MLDNRSLLTYCPRFIEKRYFVLVDRNTRQTVVSCTLCETDREKESKVIAFNFELVKAAVGWAKLSFQKKQLIPNRPYNMCNHVKFDMEREKHYPLDRGKDFLDI